MRKAIKITVYVIGFMLVAGFLIPERKVMPCCSPADYNHNSYCSDCL